MEIQEGGGVFINLSAMEIPRGWGVKTKKISVGERILSVTTQSQYMAMQNFLPSYLIPSLIPGV